MSRILITGMSAPQMSMSANKRSLSFAGAIEKVLTEAGHTVVMMEPDITWTVENLDYYDAVLVGVSPLTSLSANKAYGALHIIDVMYSSDKLTLFIDAPHPAQITASLRAISSTPENLTKPFFSYRKGYQLVNSPDVSKRLIKTVNKLLSGKWPKTIYPSLPWHDVTLIERELPEGLVLTGINLDAYLIEPRSNKTDVRFNRWAAEGPTTTWAKSIAKTLSFPIVPIRWNKGWKDEECYDQILMSSGVLLPQYKGGTWWTYRYAQAMNAQTPIATEWRESSSIGDSWSMLASPIETMTNQERNALSTRQTAEYLTSIPSKSAAKTLLEDQLGLRIAVGKGAI